MDVKVAVRSHSKLSTTICTVHRDALVWYVQGFDSNICILV